MILEDISQLYKQELWKYLEENDCLLCYRHSFYNVESKSLFDDENKQLNYLGPNIVIRNIEEFDSSLKTYSKFSGSIANEISPKFEQRKYIDSILISRLLKKISKEDREKVIKNLDKFISNKGNDDYQPIMEDCFILIKKIEEEFNKELAIAVFENIPVTISSFNYYENKLARDVAFIEDYFGKENIHLFLLQFLNRRAKKANSSEKSTIILRDFLISYYKGNEELLNDYCVCFPIIKAYLDTDENDIFHTPKLTSYVEILDIEKVKAIAAIPNWKDLDYIEAITKFLEVYKNKDSRIQQVFASRMKENKKNNFLHIGFEFKENEVIPATEIRKKIIGFNKIMPHANENKKINLIYLKKWFDVNKLEDSLTVSSKEKKIKTNKI